MMTTSAFEVLGPIMVGPSSSHTAGALRIALVARSLGPADLVRVTFTLYNSFAHTYQGHGSDRALVAGMLGLAPDDVRVRDSFELAHDAGLSFDFVDGGDSDDLHPNTVSVLMEGASGARLTVTGESVGGGRIRVSSIDGVHVRVTGDYPTIFVSHHDRPGVLARLTAMLSSSAVNIATMRTYRESKGGRAYTIFEVDQPVAGALLASMGEVDDVIGASLVNIPGSTHVSPDVTLACGFDNGAQLLERTRAMGTSIGALMRARELELAGAGADLRMRRVLEVMRAEVTEPIERPERSLGGLIGGQARSVAEGAEELASPLMGTTLSRACAYAMAVLERSATMGVIVAAPTAGSAGVTPGAVLACAETLGAEDEKIELALWNACAVGAIIARNASVAGAEGGCQAEVGSAAAMAASALVELMGGTPDQCLCAASLAISNLLGLVCDPVGGLVEVPCQARNAIGVAAAISSAQLALSGVGSLVPFDEVVATMAEVGHALPTSLRETAQGGLAATPSACAACGRACQ